METSRRALPLRSIGGRPHGPLGAPPLCACGATHTRPREGTEREARAAMPTPVLRDRRITNIPPAPPLAPGRGGRCVRGSRLRREAPPTSGDRKPASPPS